ncbi:hypothetical protein BC936DRAFT_146273, partial [Jimgerdemannia flammicorona]
NTGSTFVTDYRRLSSATSSIIPSFIIRLVQHAFRESDTVHTSSVARFHLSNILVHLHQQWQFKL